MAFATADDVGKRLGRSLTTAEQETATQVIELVTGLIVDVVDRDSDWAGELDPVPAAVKGLCIAKAADAVTNPSNLAASSETLGAYSYSQTTRRSSDSGIFLTPMEERMISRAVYGKNTGSSSTPSMVDDVIDFIEDGDIDGEAA